MTYQQVQEVERYRRDPRYEQIVEHATQMLALLLELEADRQGSSRIFDLERARISVLQAAAELLMNGGSDHIAAARQSARAGVAHADHWLELDKIWRGKKR